MLQRVEKKLGLPSLTEMGDTLKHVDSIIKSMDDNRLRILRDITNNLVRLQAQGGDRGIEMFAEVMQVIADTPPEKLDKVRAIIVDIRDTANAIQRIIRLLPVDSLKKLPVGDLVSEIRKAMKE
jgi:hypothetical protein